MDGVYDTLMALIRQRWRNMKYQNYITKNNTNAYWVTNIYRWLRHPKTTNEIRQYFASIDSGIKIRGKRAANNLPNYYDDIWFADKKLETRRQRIQGRKNYRDSIRYICDV